MTIIRPNGYTLYEAGSLTVGLAGSDYVSAVTDDDDATWVQLRQSGGFTSLAFVKWTLPALDCPSPGPVWVHTRIRWDTTTINSLPASLPEGGVRLTDSTGSGANEEPWPTLDADTITDYNPLVDTTSTAPKIADYATWLDNLANGDAEVWTTLDFQFVESNRLDILELFVVLDCGTPPLRQNQRDDLRENQRTSRQLTVRQRGYL